jgi:hypothetical protein
MTIYAFIFCAAMSCQTTRPPVTYQTLAECQADLSKYMHKPLDSEGHIVVGHQQWWACGSKKVETWEVK